MDSRVQSPFRTFQSALSRDRTRRCSPSPPRNGAKTTPTVGIEFKQKPIDIAVIGTVDEVRFVDKSHPKGNPTHVYHVDGAVDRVDDPVGVLASL